MYYISSCLLVLITGTSQRRQHESCKSPTKSLFDVGSRRISIFTIYSGLAVSVFKQGDDPIDDINKMMSFLSTVVSSRFPTTNNQLRNSSNPRQQATIHDGRVTVQPVQGRQGSFDADSGVTENPVTQMVITHNAAYQADDLDAYDYDCDDFSTARVVLMASLSSYGSNVLSEDTNSSAQQDAMILSVFEQLSNQLTNYNKVNKDNLIANESLSAHIERYKERQEPDESLFQAWERFKELLMKCPQHYLTDIQEVILFYNGLDVPTRQTLNSKGATPTKTAANVKVAIQAQLNSLEREIKKVNKKVYEVRLDANYARNHITLKTVRSKRGKPLKKLTIHSLVHPTNLEDSTKQQGQDSTNKTTETLPIRNQRASIKTLEIQIGQMRKVLQERGFGSLPNSMETNLKNHVKSILTAKADSTRICRIRSGPYAISDSQISNIFSEIVPFPMRLHDYCCDEGKEARELKILETYSIGTTLHHNTLSHKEKDPRSFTLPNFIHNVCFDKSLVDLEASVSVMPFSTYTNLSLGDLIHTRLTIEVIKHPRDVKTNLFWEFGKFTSHDGESMESYYSRFYKMMNEMIRNNLTVSTMQVNFQFLQQLQPEWSRFVTISKQQHKLDEVSYHKLFDILKQYQKEVNEIRAERIAKNANPLALVAATQPNTNPYYQALKSHKPYAPTSKASLPTRSHATTRHKGKDIAKPITPLFESAFEEDRDPEQPQKDKDMQKNLALIAKNFKKLYKPTKNNLRTSSNTKNKNVDNFPRLHVSQGKDVAVKDVSLQAEQFDWLADTDKEIDEQELEAHYSYMAKIQERQHFEQPESTSNTCLVEKDDINVIPDSPDMCNNDIQIDQNVEDERAALAYLIVNLKLDNPGESNSIRDSCLIALQNKQTELEKYMAFNDRIVDYDKLKRKLNSTLGLLAQKEIDIKEGLKLKAYDISVAKEKHDELVKHRLLTKSHHEGLVKEKTKVITDLKLKKEKDIDKMISMEKQLKFLNEIVYKRNQSIQTIHMLAQKGPTFNGRQPLKIQELIDQAWVKHSHDHFCAPIALDMEVRIKTCFMPLAIKTQNDSFTFVHELKQEMHVDLKYVESFENEIDGLESDKVEFSNMYYILLQDRNIMINRVYYVEGLNHNLFSVGQFCDADLEETNSSTPICLMATASPTQAWLWHRRLSHLNFNYINLLSKKDVMIGLPKLKYVKDQLCSSSEVSKEKRSSFKIKVVPSSKGLLNLLHMNLCGPMRVASKNRKKYVLVIIDDYSRYTWTLFLRSNDETPEVLKDFLTMIQ
nr:hypothetical protein [Tanacetum cinerariifolium]